MSKTGLAERKKNRNMEIVMHNALHFFEENGYDNTTIEQLCDAAMISQSTFFNYFGTKEKIVELVMKDGLKDCFEYREMLLSETDDMQDAARKMLMFICDANEKYCNTVCVFHRIALQRQEFRDIEEEHNALGAQMVESAFESEGKACPFSTETLKVILGGCFTDPFLTLSPKEACARTRQSISELLDHLFK
ncbi:MAG: TetR/AcrR family transcriptional regulator [Mogibacterium sp.]|nr:TetR/AcrR family transcriptional regulator [Mogibacterium sp.]